MFYTYWKIPFKFDPEILERIKKWILESHMPDALAIDGIETVEAKWDEIDPIQFVIRHGWASEVAWGGGNTLAYVALTDEIRQQSPDADAIWPMEGAEAFEATPYWVT